MNNLDKIPRIYTSADRTDRCSLIKRPPIYFLRELNYFGVVVTEIQNHKEYNIASISTFNARTLLVPLPEYVQEQLQVSRWEI